MTGFDYPTIAHSRRHGPGGYSSYESYREWLRDEFLFRCVFCLHREQWYNRGGSFHIDHFVPVSVDDKGTCEYDNLLYVCAACNEAKKAVIGLPDPCQVPLAECLRIVESGQVEALNSVGEKLRQTLLLNSKRNVSYRSRLIRILDALSKNDPALYAEMMGFPDDLPDLRKKKASSNTRPAGVLTCFFVLRENKQLSATY